MGKYSKQDWMKAGLVNQKHMGMTDCRDPLVDIFVLRDSVPQPFCRGRNPTERLGVSFEFAGTMWDRTGAPIPSVKMGTPHCHGQFQSQQNQQQQVAGSADMRKSMGPVGMFPWMVFLSAKGGLEECSHWWKPQLEHLQYESLSGSVCCDTASQLGQIQRHIRT